MAHFRLSMESLFIAELDENIGAHRGLKCGRMLVRMLDRAGSARSPRKSLLECSLNSWLCRRRSGAGVVEIERTNVYLVWLGSNVEEGSNGYYACGFEAGPAEEIKARRRLTIR